MEKYEAYPDHIETVTNVEVGKYGFTYETPGAKGFVGSGFAELYGDTRIEAVEKAIKRTRNKIASLQNEINSSIDTLSKYIVLLEREK